MQILYSALGWSNTENKNNWKSGWRAIKERVQGCCWQQAQWEAAVLPGSKESKLHPGMHQTASPASQNRWLSHCIGIHCCSLTWSTACSFAPHTLRRMWRSWNPCRGDRQDKWKPQGMSYKEQLRTLGWSYLEKMMLRDDSIALCIFLRRGGKKRDANLFSLVSNCKMHGSRSKLCQGRIRVDIRKHSFARRVARPWKRLSREVVCV